LNSTLRAATIAQVTRPFYRSDEQVWLDRPYPFRVGLGTTVDIPDIDSVLFAAPKDSVTDIVQAAGHEEERRGDSLQPLCVPEAGLHAPRCDDDGGLDSWIG